MSYLLMNVMLFSVSGRVSPSDTNNTRGEQKVLRRILSQRISDPALELLSPSSFTNLS